MWLETLSAMGPQAAGAINIDKTVKHLADALAVPNELIQQSVLPLDNIIPEDLTAALSAPLGGQNNV